MRISHVQQVPTAPHSVAYRVDYVGDPNEASVTAFTDSGTDGTRDWDEGGGAGRFALGGHNADTAGPPRYNIAGDVIRDRTTGEPVSVTGLPARVLIHPGPGDKCPTCARKVPHERKPSSPTSKPTSFRVPADEATAFSETLEAAGQHVGTAGQPFETFKTLTLALALLLQDDTVKGFATRG